MRKAMSRAPVWVRALFVCAVLPALWTVEVWIGLLLIRTPEALFGDVPDILGFIPTSVFSVALGLALIWIIVKTPFEVISLAFSPDGESASREGGIQQ